MRSAVGPAGQFFLTTCTAVKFTTTGTGIHMHNAAMGYPLFVLDMYEHAYHFHTKAAAAKYVDAFMQTVNWAEANHRVEMVVG